MSIGTTGAVLGLALLDMLSPAVIGVTLYVLLARPGRTGRLLAVYLGTVAIAYFALGVLLMLGLGTVAPVIDPTVWVWLQGAVGVALFATSFVIPDKDPERVPVPPRALTVPAMLLLGLGTWLFEFHTAVPYFGAIGIMSAAELSPAQWLPLLGLYMFIMVLPGIALYAGWALLGERTRGRLERWRDKLNTGSRGAARWIIGIAGVLIFLDALPDQVTINLP